MAVKRLTLSRYAAPGGCCHIARTRIDAKGRLPHTHDFAEVFWIESGKGRQTIDGTASDLSPGDLIFIRPDDAHGFTCPHGGFWLVNLAMSRAVVDELQARYFPHGDGPWSDGPAGRRYRLSPAGLRRLGTMSGQLAQDYGGPRERRSLDRLLLELLDCIECHQAFAAAPDWLRQALTVLGTDRQCLQTGAEALTGLCGRSREHIARTMRRTLGTTPSDLVNQMRLHVAAEALRMTGRSIIEIALDVGYSNLGYFYRRFRKAYGRTPADYRRLHGEPLGG
jgi:AraC family cel operon transcriptional repressor